MTEVLDYRKLCSEGGRVLNSVRRVNMGIRDGDQRRIGDSDLRRTRDGDL